jgi:hypothetical protein
MAERKAGLGAKGLARSRQNISEAIAAAENNKGGSVKKKVHAGTYVHDEAYNIDQHDLSPWAETPQSTRVSRYRYDHLNKALQVQWRNNKNRGYIYLEVPYETYRNFARVVSKGRRINTDLNDYDYRVMTVDEVDAPSNISRGLTSRTRA